MINSYHIKLLLIFSLIISVFSCTKPEQFSPIPQITFSHIELRDTVEKIGQSGNIVKLSKLHFDLIDGDGDVGLKENEIFTVENGTDTVYLFNFYLKLFRLKNGELVEPEIKAPTNYRIPYIEPIGQNKLLKAEISVDFTYNYDAKNKLPYDTISYEFYLYDRKGNISNTINSPVFILDTIGNIY